MDKEIFDRGIALQMAQTQEEALEILRTDPLLTEEEAQKMAALWPEKKSPSKGISQEAINTLLDLSITTEEALDKSAEITIKEAKQETREFWGQITPENGGALKMKRKNSGDPHLKIAGIIPATDEERLELMQTLLNFSAEESKELLDKMNARRKK